MMNTITRDQIKERLDNKTPMTIIEALPQRYYNAEHLPGAVNIPHDEIKTLAPDMLLDKAAFIVVYCSNTECQNSKIASQVLVQMGYTNVHEYVQGKQDWIDANFPIESTVG